MLTGTRDGLEMVVAVANRGMWCKEWCVGIAITVSTKRTSLVDLGSEGSSRLAAKTARLAGWRKYVVRGGRNERKEVGWRRKRWESMVRTAE